MDQQKLMIEWRNGCLRFRYVMATLLALVLSCLGAGNLDVVWAQNQDSPQDIFLVSYFRSQTTIPLFDTVISVTNVNDSSCQVTIVWKANDNEVLCTTESTIPVNQTHHHCSSQNPEALGVIMACRTVCDARSNSLEGHAIIQTAGACGLRIGVDAKVYSATFRRNVDGRITSTENIGLLSVAVYRFDGINLTD